MAAPIEQLVKVGFNYRQAAAIHQLLDDATPPTLRDLIRAGFTARQGRVLLSGTPSPDGGATPAIPPDFVRLVREGKFTRHQATLIRRSA